MFQVREDEPKYAFLQDKDSKEVNRYGRPIETVEENNPLRGDSLRINDDEAVGENPNRYKQHGFYFTADNCIACHACEAACSEKNDNPGHIAFRSVGFVEGGTYPDYRRQNISMACNHCDDPVCLKGCPTRAYTKFAEYGAVLQDPDICFGCGYCTWVCPYNAPQLDPVKGQVTKCNMCVDRLEVGLKPACVSACLGNALEFGVIENTPERRTQVEAEIPGFPDTDITNPNIRFQQTKTLNRDMKRVDSTAIKYHRDDGEGKYKPVLDEKHGRKKYWGMEKLLASHENAHVLFTLTAQAVMGAFLMLVIGGSIFGIAAIDGLQQSSAFAPLLIVMTAVMGLGLYKLNMHLGKPHRFYRGFNNLRHSPLSREIAGVTAFFAGLVGYTFFSFFENSVMVILANVSAALAFIGFVAGSYYMYKLYRIKARPFWDHWQTASTFYGSMFSLGALMIAVVSTAFASATSPLFQILAGLAAVGLLVEATGLFFHARDLKNGSGEGASAHYEQTTTFGKTYRLRNALLALNIVLALIISVTGLSDVIGIFAGLIFALSLITMAYLGRIIYYALVIPTTMPGAFFWKNKGFIDHARESGLADMQQLGVAYEGHHKFDVKELMQTLKENSISDMLAHAKSIVTGK
ncbi:MAG: Anaerobic dimethyl sulfoxide reductase chain B (EC [uncultured Thiotrichaceae bacterium]|uniref:Anaerobic dimethyl sulfoxide reductase chain B (EC) n=1 Tax=uncultured Thiotrichaceae bacterium TaxID=298394 RepID=A0A6S6SPG8_9GAMM|nr:MAG: Anaerobic dimethyl sulfoxide reductase chain B (EC [uncultured Thiotrichaceae bacterium]